MQSVQIERKCNVFYIHNQASFPHPLKYCDIRTESIISKTIYWLKSCS